MKQTLIKIHGEIHRVDRPLQEILFYLSTDIKVWHATTSSGDNLIIRPDLVDVIELKEVGE